MSLTRDKYTRRMKAQLDDLNLTMAYLEKRAKGVQKGNYQELTELHRQSRIAVAKLHEVKSANEASWGQMVLEMDQTRDAFVHSFNDFTAHL